jgi:hypothetical protein
LILTVVRVKQNLSTESKVKEAAKRLVALASTDAAGSRTTGKQARDYIV